MRTHLKRPASSMLRVNSETHASVLREANNCLLVLDKVTKDYVTDGEPVRALHDISLEVATGQFLALVGRSGCGKSTLLNLAGAMHFPTSGQVLVDGISTNSLRAAGLTLRRSSCFGRHRGSHEGWSHRGVSAKLTCFPFGCSTD